MKKEIANIVGKAVEAVGKIGSMYAERDVKRDLMARDYWMKFDPRHESTNDLLLTGVMGLIIIILIIAIVIKNRK